MKGDAVDKGEVTVSSSLCEEAFSGMIFKMLATETTTERLPDNSLNKYHHTGKKECFRWKMYGVCTFIMVDRIL